RPLPPVQLGAAARGLEHGSAGAARHSALRGNSGRVDRPRVLRSMWASVLRTGAVLQELRDAASRGHPDSGLKRVARGSVQGMSGMSQLRIYQIQEGKMDD